MPHKPRPPYDPGDDYRARKRAAGRCICYRCDAPAGKRLARCYRHEWQRKKEADPVAYIFYHKRQRAIERGKEQPWGNVVVGGEVWTAWSLTLENFRDWCAATGYHEKTGRTAASMSLDRKDNRFGYHVWNIKALTLGQNSSKGQKSGEWVYDAAKDEYVYQETGEYEYEDAPF